MSTSSGPSSPPRSGSSWPAWCVDYQALKARLGLVEFADQMAIAARLATEVPAGVGGAAGRRSGWCCWTSTRTPPRPRRSCCAACSPGTDAERGPWARRSRRSATRSRRSTAGAGRRPATSSRSPRTSAGRTADRPRRFALTVNRRSGRHDPRRGQCAQPPAAGADRSTARRAGSSGSRRSGCSRRPAAPSRSGAGGDLRDLAGGGQLDRRPDRRAAGRPAWSRAGPTWRC